MSSDKPFEEIKVIQDNVKDYYGKQLGSSDDLKTNACCTDAAPPTHISLAISNVHDEVLMRYYGCGLIAPEALEGCRVLDLGSGAGRDVYVIAQLVGESGEVVGVDMTEEQLAVANKYKEWHKERFGYKNSNVRFIEGELEKLDQLDLEPGSFDVIVSNCVINLCQDKEAVLRGAYRLLKEGGEMYFADVYSDRRVKESLRKDPVLWGECLSGALYVNDFIATVREAGFKDPRIVSARRLTIENAEIEKKVGDIKFYSVTYRLFKIPKLEPGAEDYGQSVKYKGSIETCPDEFELDDHHTIKTGAVFPVCGNTHLMLKNSRFAPHFEFRGTFDEHFGAFAECGPAVFDTADEATGPGSCCTPSSTDSDTGGCCC